MEKTMSAVWKLILLKRINLNGNTIGFRPRTQKLRARTKLILSYESTAEEVSFEWSQHRISSTDSRGRTTIFQDRPFFTLVGKGFSSSEKWYLFEFVSKNNLLTVIWVVGFVFTLKLFKNVAERGRVAQMLMEAHEAYRAGNIDTALLKYAMLAELGYEVAQSNVAYILDHGKFLSRIAFVYGVSDSFWLVKSSLSPAMLALAQVHSSKWPIRQGLFHFLGFHFSLCSSSRKERGGREKGRRGLERTGKGTPSLFPFRAFLLLLLRRLLVYEHALAFIFTWPKIAILSWEPELSSHCVWN